jgi:hypothetical protein
MSETRCYCPGCDGITAHIKDERGLSCLRCGEFHASDQGGTDG